jgi:DNA-binding protein H-NS
MAYSLLTNAGDIQTMPSYQELLAQREQLDKQIKEAVQREKADGIAKAKVIIEQYGLNASDLFSRKAGRSPQSTVILQPGRRGQAVVKRQNGLKVKIEVHTLYN